MDSVVSSAYDISTFQPLSTKASLAGSYLKVPEDITERERTVFSK